MSEFTRIASIDPGALTPEARIGDVMCQRTSAQVGLAWVCDVVPYNAGPVTKVCVEKSDESREWMTVEELRKRFAFRRRA